YTNVYDSNGNSSNKPEARIIGESSASEFPQDEKTVYLFGSGAEKCVPFLPPPKFQIMDVKLSATNLVPLALEKFAQKDFADLAYFSPFYLKSPNITKAKPKL
ncbi:MAG: tRNA (adenosine(37)-N6)-threonylcarbamoyltransferase complex dimerization subunit type 1 TsaB, partial [Bacteroidetes bacterium]